MQIPVITIIEESKVPYGNKTCSYKLEEYLGKLLKIEEDIELNS